MGATTSKASNAPRKCTPSQKKCDTDNPAAAPAPKRAKTVVFINPEQIPSDPPSDDEELTSDTIEEPEDVSMQEYTLTTSIMLDTISIYGDTHFGNLANLSIGNLRSIQLKDWTKPL